ncbi:MAG TPA: orotidine-5'-phosphate decarboxylase [Abditibacteriaceae bacterium]|nr:orotidine-5'-phosphate decarboxylase [Abditibacteriaceae bacterium]
MIADRDAARNPVLVALDVPTAAAALELAQRLRPYVGGFKVGLELFCAAGPAIVEDLGPANVFLDLKFHDIPNTVAGAVRATARSGVMMLNVHCLGGTAMMRAAVEAGREVNGTTKIIGVTILTSHDAPQLRELGLNQEPTAAVLRLALLARETGLDGVVCSPQEVKAVRAECGSDFLLVTPGIRPSNSVRGDQKRVLTPQQTLAAGADWLVIGRPITEANDPERAARDILV